MKDATNYSSGRRPVIWENGQDRQLTDAEWIDHLRWELLEERKRVDWAKADARFFMRCILSLLGCFAALTAVLLFMEIR